MCRYRSYSNARIKFQNLHYKALGIERKKVEADDVSHDLEPLVQLEPINCKCEGVADVAVINAVIHGHDKADCLLVKENRIIYVGEKSKISEHIADGTELIDAEMGYVTPGLCDSHVHLAIGAEHYQGCDVESVTSFDDFVSRVREFATENPDERAIRVYGLHYFDPPIIPKEKTRHILDSIVADKPLFVYAHDLHTGWANTAALKEAGFFYEMPPWPKEAELLDICDNIELDDDGFPTGELREPEAYFLVEATLRSHFPLTVDQKLSALKEACDYFASLGITSVHNMGLALPEEDIELLLLLLELEAKGELPIRVSNSFSVVPDENMLTDVDCAARIRDAFRVAVKGELSYNDLHGMLVRELKRAANLRHKAFLQAKENISPVKSIPHAHHQLSERLHSMVHEMHAKPHIQRFEQNNEPVSNAPCAFGNKISLHSVKIFMDGVIEKNTAYRDDIRPVEGIPGLRSEELEAVVTRSDRLGLQVSSHCIGDASVNSVLNEVTKVRKLHSDEDKKRGHLVRHRIEHIELCEPEDIDRFACETVIPSMQPLHERPPVTLWHTLVPQYKWHTAFPWNDLINTGASLTFGSDWPIVSCNCLAGIERAVKRTPWLPGMKNQGIDFDQALQAFTRGNAYSEYQENIRGKLAPGMLADITILKGDLDKKTPTADKLECVCTICDGKITYSKI